MSGLDIKTRLVEAACRLLDEIAPDTDAPATMDEAETHDEVIAVASGELVAGAAEIARLRAELERLMDRTDGLNADLFEAVQVAYRRGATEWARLNYPKWLASLQANAEADSKRQSDGPRT